MNPIKRASLFAVSLLLCGSLAVPAFATETESTQNADTAVTQTDSGLQFTEVNETVYSMASVNIRSGPGTQYTRLGTLQYGYSVTRIGVSESGWSMVLWEDQVAYIFSSYLSTTRPKGYNSKIDDTELLYQIAIANGLKRADYTQETWSKLEAALIMANSALNGNSQAAADDAEKQLAKAIDELVKMNYAALESVLAEAEELVRSGGTSTLWYELASAAVQGEELLTSGDQAAVDVTTEQIRTLLTQIREALKNPGSLNVVVQEVPVEVPPTEAYCNIPAHRVWPILFAISLTLNVALAVLIVMYIRNKKKNQHDDTPLVDYDIFDDTF